MKMKLILSIVFVALFLTGCSVTTPAVMEYRLTPKITATPQQKCKSKSLKLLAVKSPNVFKTQQMRYVIEPFTEGSFTQSSWAYSPNSMLQRELYLALDRSSAFEAVYDYDSLGDAKWLVELHLDEFVQYFDAAQKDSFVRIAIDVTLYDGKSKRVIAKHYFTKKIPTQSADALGGVDAMNKAFGLILEDIVEWIEGSC